MMPSDNNDLHCDYDINEHNTMIVCIVIPIIAQATWLCQKSIRHAFFTFPGNLSAEAGSCGLVADLLRGNWCDGCNVIRTFIRHAM